MIPQLFKMESQLLSKVTSGVGFGQEAQSLKGSNPRNVVKSILVGFSGCPIWSGEAGWTREFQACSTSSGGPSRDGGPCFS